ncbi:FAD-binding oxidoreductase [Roseobacter sp. YSTF-M11]|uniref:FAD-binding oxidoreductase n=1 Tax=Roseobacter insulae TaxID=2859783 RepID=A0A9X1FVD2_9RHOB|nr:FAD-dependent oxidoreductase [Roseobacter insulae]MBW4708064.1 FAD-binding oxidoreductase [Roseobacter insulae]
MKIIVIGAGIVGTLTAYRLAAAGASVTVLEAGHPVSAASGASFGWINASFFEDADHFRLRAAGIDAHRRLATDLDSRAVRWPGTLCWDAQGDAFDDQRNTLKELGYAVQEIDAKDFAALEPHVSAPERALHFTSEGAVDLVTLARDALRACAARHVQVITGVAASGFVTQGNAVTGVETDTGVLTADQVVVAAGVATQGLLRNVGLHVPMLDRPGLILRSDPMPPLVRHVLVAPGQELRQTPRGHFLAPTAAHHQGDTADRITQTPDRLADRAMIRLRALLGRDLRWEEITRAYRPVPADGLPVIGACGPAGLYVMTMHSGATLAPLAAELAAAEIMGAALTNVQSALLTPYRPQRFTG